MSNLSFADRTDARTPTGATYELPASVVNSIKDWINTPTTEGTTFDDSGDITIDGTYTYSTTRAVTDSTHTLTLASSGHVSNSYIHARYSFSQACTITLNNFDPTLNKTGTINPIPAGTYDLFFTCINSNIGGSLIIPNNLQTSQTQLQSPASFSASPGNTENVLSWNSVVNATGYTLEFSTDQSTWTDLSTVTYDGTSTNYTHTSLTNSTTYYYRVKATASGYIDSPYSTNNATPNSGDITPPTLSNYNIDQTNLDRINFNSSEIITGTTFAGFTIASPSRTISAININAGLTTGHYFTVNSAFGITDSPTIAYSGTGSNIQDANGNALQAFSATAITNNAFDPTDIGSLFIDVRESNLTALNPFDGSTEYYDTTETGQAELTGDFEFWVKANFTDGQAASTQVVFGNQNGATGTSVCVHLVIDTGGKIVSRVGDGNVTTYIGRSANAIFNDGATGIKVIRFKHLSNQMYYYIDGGAAEAMDATFTGDTTGWSGYSTTDNIYLGAQNSNGTAAQFTGGIFYNLFGFSDVLTAGQVSNMEAFLGL